jgi:hypothetical protein
MQYLNKNFLALAMNYSIIWKVFWLYFFPLASFYFYEYVNFNLHIIKLIYFAIIPIVIVYVSSELIKTHKDSLYIKLVKYIFVLIVLSVFIACVFWGQNILLSYRSTAQYIAIIYFFILLKIKPDLKLIENIISCFCVLHLACWIYGMMKAPELTFGINPENTLDDSRGVFRLNIRGFGFVILGFFFAICKYSETRMKKWILIFTFLFIIIVLHVTRQVIVISLIISLIYLLKNSKYLWILTGISTITFLFINNKTLNEDSLIGRLFALTNRQIELQQSGEEEYIRITEYRYFFTEYSKNTITDILGNGVPHGESDYGKREIALQQHHLYTSDVGYAAIYTRIGMLGLIFYCLIFYRVARQKVPTRCMYAKLFMIYMIFANIAASWVFHDMIVICICLYILEYSQIKKSNKYEILNRNTGI